MLNFVDINHFVIFSYLIFILGLGFFCGKGIKGIQDYAIAEKSFGTVALILTFLATSFGAGSVIGDIAKVMEDGILFYISMSSFFVFCIYMSKYIAPHFDQRFAGMISAADMMRYFYGHKAESITAICGFLVCILSVGGQIIALGHIFEGFFSIDYKYIVLVTGIVITVYSSVGGIKAVTITDIFQFSILLIIMPIMTFLVIKHAGGIEYIFSHVPEEKLHIAEHKRFGKYMSLLFIGMLPFLWVYPPLIQRFLMARHSQQISKMYNMELITRSIFMIMIIAIAFAALIAFPDVEFKKVMPAILNDALPDGIKGLMVVAILSVSMSTADSHLNSASILISNNLFRHQSSESKLSIARISTILLGILGVTIAIEDFDIVEIVILSFGTWGSAIGIPLMAGILNLPVSKSAFWSCCATSMFGLVGSMLFFEEPGLISSCVAIAFGCIGFSIPYWKFRYNKFISSI